MKVYSGHILTVDKADNEFRYLVENGGRIAFVGDALPREYACVPVEELGERALIPAFVDTHQHFASFSLFNAGLNVMEAVSNAQIKEMVRQFAQKEGNNKKTLIAFGASPYSVAERKLVSRRDLDEACPDKPVVIIKYDGHACIVNSRLMKRLEKKISGLRGCHPDTGEMNQEAFFAVSNYLSNSVPVFRLMKYMQQAVDYEAEHGIGMIHSVSGVGFPMDMDISLEKLFASSVQSGMQIRIFPQSMDTGAATSRHLPRIGGCFACALDGCYGSGDAAMNQPYLNGDSGVLYYSDEKVTEFCKKANRLGLQIELHAIGDRAFDQAARAIKAALDDFPRTDHRHGIIHACLPTPEGMDICAKYHICLPMQIAFDNWRQEPAEYIESLMGSERCGALNPVRSFMERGCLVAFGSDGPCTDPDPIVWLHKAVNHSNPRQAVDIRQALRMSTYNGCLMSFDESERGSLEVGKIADMALLSQSPYDIPSEKLKELKVEKLYLGGREYKKQSQSVAEIILKGLGSKAKI